MSRRSSLPPLPKGIRARLDLSSDFPEHYERRPVLMAWSIVLFVFSVIFGLAGWRQGDEIAQIVAATAIGLVTLSAIASRFWQDRPASGMRRLATEAVAAPVAIVLLLAFTVVSWGFIAGFAVALLSDWYLIPILVIGLFMLAWVTRSLKNPGGLGLRSLMRDVDRHWDGHIDR